jgi:hypothetical protein
MPVHAVDIGAPSLNEIILNVALTLLFYVCGHGFLFQSCSIRNRQYAHEVWHQTPGTLIYTLFHNSLRDFGGL